MRVPRQALGFSLIEALIVMVLLIGAATITIGILGAQQKTQQRQALVYEQAAEMSKLTVAVESYLATAEGLPDEVDTIFAISLADVIAAGLLPGDFASRPASGTTAPVSPMGQLYSVSAVLTADGYRALVVPTGTPNAGFMARAGVPNTEAAVREYSAAVMQRMRQEFNRVASVITKDTKTVDSAVTGFSYDLSQFLASAPTIPTVVGMANFSDLEVVAETGGGGGGSVHTCSLTTNRACASGTTEEWTYTTCTKWGSGHEDEEADVVVNTPGGTIHIERQGSSSAPMPPPLVGAHNSPFNSDQGQLPVYTTKPVGVANWGNPQFDYGRTSIMTASKCSMPTQVEFKPYKLTCPTTGEILETYYNSTCGEWYQYLPAPGDSCSPGGYQFSADAMYQGGLTDSTRALQVVGIGAPTVPGAWSYNSQPYIETLVDSEPVVRTLSACPGSTYAQPINIRRKDMGNGKSFEYMEIRSGQWRERVTYSDGSTSIYAPCEMENTTTANYSSPGVPTGVNNCPSGYYKNADGSQNYRKGLEHFVLPYPETERTKVLRLCCS